MQPPRPEERRHTKPAPLRDAILAAITAAGERGMSQRELREQLNIKATLLTAVISQYKAAGYVHAVGPQMHRRYFTDARLADAAAGRVEQEVAQRAAAAAEQLRTQRREIERRQAQRRRDAAELVRLRDRVARLEAELAKRQAEQGAAIPAAPVAAQPVPAPVETPPPVASANAAAPAGRVYRAGRLQGDEAQVEPKPSRRRAAPRVGRPGAELVAKTSASQAAPVRIDEEQRRPRGEVIVPENVKRTIAPAPAGRFEVSGPVIGGFATMRPGQYLPESGFSSYLDGGAR